MSRPAEIEDMVGAAIKHFGAVDILVNNGIQHVSPIEAFPWIAGTPSSPST